MRLSTPLLPLLALLTACPAPDDSGGKDTSVDTGGHDTAVDSTDTNETGETGDSGGCGDGTDPVDWYRDADQDGYGDAAATQNACAQPKGYVADNTDCDDLHATAFPGNPEVCDLVDNDCNGTVDDDASDAKVYYADADGDHYGDLAGAVTACSMPSGDVTNSRDCDDADADVHPNAQELCNSVDDDCDGSIDEDALAPSWYADADGDGYGDPATGVEACDAPASTIADGTDCDDTDANAFPGNPETCDSVDNDCNGKVDDDAAGSGTWYADNDGDSYGDPNVSLDSCTQPAGYVNDASDCDDSDSAVNPLATEVCNLTDDDCNGSVDDAPSDESTFYADSDSDGYGDSASTATACFASSGWVSDSTDCDDGDGAVHPGASETCNLVDDDCDGSVDDSAVDRTTYYADSDADTYGDASVSQLACSSPGSGWVTVAGDCDDGASDVNPAATEVCDFADNDCDGSTDEGAAAPSTWYSDSDADGFGDDSSAVSDCTAPSGAIAVGGDCDDADSDTYPGAPEVCPDGVVNDCSGTETAALAECDTWGTTLGSADAYETVDADAWGYNVVDFADANDDGVYEIAWSVVTWAPPTAVSESDEYSAVFVVDGPQSGTVDATSATEISDTDIFGSFGTAVAMRDLDGDGNAELLVGAPDAGDGGTSAGAVYLFAGPLSTEDVSAAQLRLDGAASSYIGDQVALMADQDGDGTGELVVGAQAGTGGAAYSGVVWVVSGITAGAGTASGWALATFDGAAMSDHFGTGLHAADLNGDGTEDLAIGARGAATTYLWEGPVSGSYATGSADATFTGSSGWFGYTLASGDNDGDGATDLYVGSPNYNAGSGGEGAVFVFEGPFSGSTSYTAAAAVVTGADALDRVGGSLSVADVNEDGSADLGFTHGYSSRYGSTTSGGTGDADGRLFWGPLSGAYTNNAADVTVSSAWSLDFVSDQDGDGWDDLAWGDASIVYFGSFPGF